MCQYKLIRFCKSPPCQIYQTINVRIVDLDYYNGKSIVGSKSKQKYLYYDYIVVSLRLHIYFIVFVTYPNHLKHANFKK